MPKKIKIIVKNYLKKRGYIKCSEFHKFSLLNLILLHTLAIKGTANIIQIGSNDGKNNDPLFDFLMQYGNKTRAILFEPQIQAFEKLKQNYKDFAHFKFINKAIGTPGVSPFFMVNQAFQDIFLKKTGREFGTRLNSFVKDHVIKRIKTIGLQNAEQYIDIQNIECVSLYSELNKMDELKKEFDLLQIDCESYDDEVIYNSSIEKINPLVINFEHKNLTPLKIEQLHAFLNLHGYAMTQWSKSDTIAIKTK